MYLWSSTFTTEIYPKIKTYTHRDTYQEESTAVLFVMEEHWTKPKHWLKHSTKPGKSRYLTRDHSTATKRNKIIDMRIYLGRVYDKIINFKKKISEYLYNDSLYIKQKFAYTDTCADINVQIHRKP